MRGRACEEHPNNASCEWQFPFGNTELNDLEDDTAIRKRSFLPFGRKKGDCIDSTDVDEDSLQPSFPFHQYFRTSAYFDESRDESDYESVAPNITKKRSVRFNDNDPPSEADYPAVRHHSEDSLVTRGCLPSSRLGRGPLIHVKEEESTARTRRWFPRCGRTDEELAQLKEEDDAFVSFFGLDAASLRDDDDNKKRIPLNCFRRRKVGHGDNSITNSDDNSMNGSFQSGFAAYLAETDAQGRVPQANQQRASNHYFSRQQPLEQQRYNRPDPGFADYACAADAFGCMYEGVEDSFESDDDHPRRYWFRVSASSDSDSQDDSLAAMSHVTRRRSTNVPRNSTKTNQRIRSRNIERVNSDYSDYTDTESGMFSLYSLQAR